MKASFLLIFLFASCSLFAQSVEDYNWNNVPIGGGGYITGMKIHPLDSDKRFYRTDVGGAYRWDPATQKMEQMIFLDNKNFYSVAGIALHPTDPDILYLAVGRNCNPSQNAILKSTDGGVNFSIVPIQGGVPFWFAANGGRACDTQNDTNGANNGDKDRQGTPLAINPLNPNDLYIGTREKGLYILNLTSFQLTQISSVNIPYNSDQYSIRYVVFHPSEPYVYIAYAGHGVFIGNTNTQAYWNLDYPGGASYPQLLDAIDISISKNADYLLVACRTQGIMKATNITAGVSWSQITGLNAADDEGYLTVDCSPHENDVAITVVADWNHINEFQVTTNAGGSWSQIAGSVPSIGNIFPWRSEAFASHVSQIAFDPQVASRMYYTSWFSTFASDNFTLTGPNIWHNVESKGHEEIVATDLVALPNNSSGYFLMSGSGDHPGFLLDQDMEHQDSFATFDISDLANQSWGVLKKSASMDFCEKQADNLVLTITEEWTKGIGGMVKSSDGGLHWDLVQGYSPAGKKGIVAMASNDPDNIVVLNSLGLQYSLDGGATAFQNAVGTTNLTQSCTVPFTINCLGATNMGSIDVNNSVFAGYRNIVADKSLNCVFYYYDWDGTFSISTNNGVSWCIVNNNTLPSSNSAWNKTRLISIPNQAGHLWINVNEILFHSSNGGKDWVNYTSSVNSEVDKVRALSFGKGFNNNYEALYIFGSIDNVSGNYFYRSDDVGQTWIKINDHSEKESWGDNKIIAGDRNIPGRLYSTASGQGVIFGSQNNPIICDNAEKTIDGEFNSINNTSIPNWVQSEINGASMSGTINNWTKAVLDVTSPGSFNYDLQLWQDDHEVIAGQSYLIELDLRADSDRHATIKLRNKPNGTTYLERTVEVTDESAGYAFIFKPDVNDDDVRLTLMIGGETPTVYVDHIRFKAFCPNDANQIICLEQMVIDELSIPADSYHAADLVKSNGKVTFNNPVDFKSGNTIQLEFGFTVELGASFSAQMIGCP